MEVRDLTISFLAFWEGGCASEILDRSLTPLYIRRRNQWINGNIHSGLVGFLLFNQGEVVGFLLAMPVESAPLPIIGNGYSVILCNWVKSVFATPKNKGLLVKVAVEKLRHRGFPGIISMTFAPNELSIWEAAGFSPVGEFDFWGFPVKVMVLRFVSLKQPVLQKPVPLPPPRQKKYAIDVFAPSYCPFGTLVISKVIRQTSDFAGLAELRIHDTGIRDVVIRTGRVFGVFLNGENITRQVLAGVPIMKIIGNLEAKRRFEAF